MDNHLASINKLEFNKTLNDLGMFGDDKYVDDECVDIFGLSFLIKKYIFRKK